MENRELAYGFDGVREGQPSNYPYKNERAFKARLQERGL